MNVSTIEQIRSEIANEVIEMERERDRLYQYVEQGIDPTKLIVNVSYPHSEEYDYETYIDNLNLEDECDKGLKSGRDFLITDHRPIQKEVKSENGIFSTKYGQTLSDMEPYIDRWKCPCGKTKHAIYEGTKCKYCGGIVKYVDDDFGCFGWLKLKNKKIIHPNLYKNIESMVGGPQVLINILDIVEEVDENGHPIQDTDDKILTAKEGNYASDRKLKTALRRRSRAKAAEPFYGKGMTYFREHFDEIMDYYLKTASNKQAKKVIYDHIYANRDKIFTSCIPVYTTHLRPFNITNNKEKFDFEGTNANFNMMSKLVHSINNDRLKIDRHGKKVERKLWSLQREWIDLYSEIDSILSGKKGNVRLLAGGRCNFSGRAVIIQNQSLRSDQVILPYPFLVTILEQQIINTLVKTYGISYNDARNRWYKSIDEPDKTIVQIIYGLIKSRPEGLAVVINRNPSIQRGSLLQMFCIDMSFNYTMSLPLAVLEIMGADFDGDVLNIYYIVNEAFFRRCYQVINPRNSMNISNNDGKSNSSLLPYKDTLINSNTMLNLGRSKYSAAQLKKIKEFMNKYNKKLHN